jgi:hypothetical protein
MREQWQWTTSWLQHNVEVEEKSEMVHAIEAATEIGC